MRGSLPRTPRVRSSSPGLSTGEIQTWIRDDIGQIKRASTDRVPFNLRAFNLWDDIQYLWRIVPIGECCARGIPIHSKEVM
jgi:hypothetical protein